jgi:membrane fusion protein, multidrug efflux system
MIRFSYLIISIVLLMSCGKGSGGNKAGEKKFVVAVEGFIVKTSEVKQIITVSGTVKPYEETVLTPDISGRVVMLNLPEGKFVSRGTLLVKLFDDDLLAQLNKMQAQYNLLVKTEQRQSELLKINGISQNDYDLTALQMNAAKADMEVVKAQIRKTEILAPFDGFIGLRNVSVGTQVNPSVALATIRTSDKLKLDFSIPEEYSAMIKPGMKVDFTVGNEEKPFEAEVIASEKSIDPLTRNLKLRADIHAKSELLTPGTYATVQLILRDNKNALMIPTQSVIPQERLKRVIVARNGKAAFIPVKTAIRKESLIEVTSGLKAGDTIAVTGIMFLKPDMPIKFSKIN